MKQCKVCLKKIDTEIGFSRHISWHMKNSDKLKDYGYEFKNGKLKELTKEE